MSLPCKQCSTNKHLYQWQGLEFQGGSDKKMRKMWFGLEIVIWFAFLPSCGSLRVVHKTAYLERNSTSVKISHIHKPETL